MTNLDKSTNPTVKDVAQHAGVSTATVSRFLNEPDKLSPKAQKKVSTAIKALNFVPNFGARILASNKSHTIGAVVPTLQNAIFATGLQAFQDRLAEHGKSLLVAASQYDPEQEHRQIRNLISRGADALMLVGHDRKPEALEFLAATKIPYVVCWADPSDDNIASVGFDNQAAMQDLARQILDLGHRHIGIIAFDTTINDRARQRVQGILNAAQITGVPKGNITIKTTDYSRAAAAAAAESILCDAPNTTVLFCGNDVLATGAMTAARTMGLSIPDDLTVTGFDDLEVARIVTPELTTVSVPQLAMGKAAADLLTDMAYADAQARQVSLDTTVMLRNSHSRPR